MPACLLVTGSLPASALAAPDALWLHRPSPVSHYARVPQRAGCNTSIRMGHTNKLVRARTPTLRHYFLCCLHSQQWLGVFVSGCIGPWGSGTSARGSVGMTQLEFRMPRAPRGHRAIHNCLHPLALKGSAEGDKCAVAAMPAASPSAMPRCLS